VPIPGLGDTTGAEGIMRSTGVGGKRGERREGAIIHYQERSRLSLEL